MGTRLGFPRHQRPGFYHGDTPNVEPQCLRGEGPGERFTARKSHPLSSPLNGLPDSSPLYLGGYVREGA